MLADEDRRDSFGEAMSFHVAPLNPFPGLGSFSRSYVRSCRRTLVAGLAVQAGITGLQFGRNLSPLPPSAPPSSSPSQCSRSLLLTFVQFDLSRAIAVPRA